MSNCAQSENKKLGPDLKTPIQWHLYIIFSIIGILSLMFAFIYHAHTSGFCFKTGRYITEEEVKRIALQSIVDISHNSDSTGKARKGYSDIDDLLRQNPSCCSLDTSAEIAKGYDFMDRLLGNVYGAMELEYFQDPGMRDTRGLARVPVSVCGEIILEN